jgi:glycosyltransferase A (GT-A) superfamily protein (DUF2064 family)
VCKAYARAVLRWRPKMRRGLIVVGKAPEAGLAKTRLVPPLSLHGAAEMYRGFLLDAVELGHTLGWERVSVIHPRGAVAALRDLLPARDPDDPAR